MNELGHGISVEIATYRGGGSPTEELRAFRRAARGAHVQTLDADAVAGKRHLLLTLKQTVEMSRCARLLADKTEVDFLLRVAGTKQIADAVRDSGAKPASNSIIVVFGPPESVRQGMMMIGRLKRLVKSIPHAPGRSAAARVARLKPESVVHVEDVASYLLAERAALLHK